jgi:hypothetical protein
VLPDVDQQLWRPVDVHHVCYAGRYLISDVLLRGLAAAHFPDVVDST